MDYRELQDSKNLNNQQLADKIGIPRTTVSKYKNGHLDTKNMTLEMAVKWLRALGRRKMANDALINSSPDCRRCVQSA